MSRFFLRGAAAGALALSLWVAAPALSLTPYSPRPVEFEQSLPPLRATAAPAVAVGAGDGGAIRFASGVIEAPARFDLVGIGGEMRPVEYRWRSHGGPWSDWVEVDSGDPVWTGGADQLELRSRHGHPRGRLHYVNVSGTDTTAHRLLGAVRSSVNSAFISMATTLGVESAAAAPAQPAMIGRRRWDPNNRCKPRVMPAYGKVKAAVVHHTIIGGNDYTRAKAKSIVLGICLFHRNGNGWNDIGYQALVDRFGRLYIGRAGGIGKAVVGAQALGFNAETTGIATIGDHRKLAIKGRQLDALTTYLAWKLAHHHALPVNSKVTLTSQGGSKYKAGRKISVGRIVIHRNLDATDCPGDSLAAQLRQIRRRVANKVAAR